MLEGSIIIININTISDRQQSVNLLADAVDLPLEGIEVNSAWLGVVYVVRVDWEVQGVQRRGKQWRGYVMVGALTRIVVEAFREQVCYGVVYSGGSTMLEDDRIW